jgi:hypothetical protein
MKVIATTAMRLFPAVVVALVAASPAPGKTPTPEPTTANVRLALEQLPRYGVFDLLEFRVDKGAVTLGGYAYGPWLKSDAAEAVRHLPGVDEVADTVRDLPVSRTDDRIRWVTFFQIYTDDALERYAPGGASGARFDAFQFGGLQGRQPCGYPIHIIVRAGRTTLAGAVNSAGDRQTAEMRARDVSGVLAVDNQLIVTR